MYIQIKRNFPTDKPNWLSLNNEFEAQNVTANICHIQFHVALLRLLSRYGIVCDMHHKRDVNTLGASVQYICTLKSYVSHISGVTLHHHNLLAN